MSQDSKDMSVCKLDSYTILQHQDTHKMPYRCYSYTGYIIGFDIEFHWLGYADLRPTTSPR